MAKKVKKNDIFCDINLISKVFLGVGLTLFVLNISSFLSFLPQKYNFIAFDISIFGAILIVIYSTYILYKNKN